MRELRKAGQFAVNRLIRPTSVYVGEMGTPFVPIDKRKG
jgi:citrate synthase